MFTLKHENRIGKSLSLLFFIIVIIEVVIEFFFDKGLLFFFKPLLSIGIMVLYWNMSKKRNWLFFIVLFLSLITNVLFIPNTQYLLFLGLLVFLVHRILLIYYVIQLIKLKDYIPFFIAIIPFVFIFFYLLLISTGIDTKSYVLLVFQNILISVIGGLALSEYLMDPNKKNAWLFIFGLLSLTQYFIVFIEKYYLSNLAPIVFRPLAMLLNAGVYYVFYRFVIHAEKKKKKNIS